MKVLGLNNFAGYIFAGIVCAFSSCEIINPAEPVPAYIHIDSIPLLIDNSTQGSSASNFTDAWVFVDGKYLGTYELPVTFPVIGSGSHVIGVRAGIIENGISSTRAAYPVLATSQTTCELSANETQLIAPQVHYLSGSVFRQVEDFDDGSLSMIPLSASSVPLTVTSAGDPNAFEGNSGKAELDDNHTLFEVASSDSFQLPVSVPVYMELNYKCDVEFKIGTIINTPFAVINDSLINIRPTSTWKKIYVNISKLGGVNVNGLGYKVYLRATKIQDGTIAHLYFDNLKVLY